MLHQLEQYAQIVIIHKMKVLILLVLAAVVLVKADSPYKYLLRQKRNVQVCTPGETRKEDCNNCFCIPDGSGWGCTRMGCNTRPVVLPETAEVGTANEAESGDRSKRDADHCVPGSHWMQDCNHCWCLANGIPACNLMACPPKNSLTRPAVNL